MYKNPAFLTPDSGIQQAIKAITGILRTVDDGSINAR